MHNVELILTLTAGLSAALALGFLARRMKLPPLVGYLLAGLLLGPYTPGFVANREIAEQLAEVGVILLMFGVGLHFHLKDLLAVRGVAVTGALVQIAAATLLGTLAARSFGWSWTAGTVFGVALSVASTVVLMRVLADNRDLQTQAGHIAIGWLVVEDVFTVFVLVVLPAVVAAGQGGNVGLAAAIGLAALKLAALTALTLGPGAQLIPRLLTGAARTNSRELFTLTVLVIALGIAVGSAKIFGVSMALGAFLAGMVVGQSEFSHRAASEALPMRDAFAVLFFVSVGMLFDPQHLVRAPVLTLITLAIILVGKPLAAFLIVMLLGYGVRIGLRVSAALAQIGEFSFMLTTLGSQLRVLPDGATDSVIAASIVSITLNPLLYRLIPRVEQALRSTESLKDLLEPRDAVNLKIPHPRGNDEQRPGAIVVGYGPVGRTVTGLLEQCGIQPTVIDLNIETVRRLSRQGVRAIYGDAADPGVLEGAGIARAVALVLSPQGTEESAEVVRLARKMKPDLEILARAAFLSGTTPMLELGADEVFSGEAEVAMAMVEAILRRQGATSDRMDQELKRVREELYRTH